MKKLIDIGGTYFSSDNKLVLIGTNIVFDNLLENDIKNLIKNKKVTLSRPEFDDVELNILDIKVANSLIDKKNFFLLIGNNLSPDDIVDGSEIYYE